MTFFDHYAVKKIDMLNGVTHRARTRAHTHVHTFI